MKIFRGICAVALGLSICFSVAFTSSATEAVVVCDANGDRKVSVIDLVRAKRYMTNSVDEITFNAVDFDLSGIIDLDDLAKIRDILLDENAPDMIVNAEDFEIY